MTPCTYDDEPMSGWIPWVTLRESSEITLRWGHLPEGVRGVYAPNTDGTATIVLDARLDRVQRKATLGHELEHHRRGITGDPRTDERGVEDEVARRLVPHHELYAMWEIAVLNDLPVEVYMVAERFDVPDRVAERAMLLFLGKGTST